MFVRKVADFSYYGQIKVTKCTIFLIQGVVLCEICTSWVVHRLNSTCTNLLITNSTSTNFIPIALKFVLVKFELVETVLAGVFSNLRKSKTTIITLNIDPTSFSLLTII